MNSDQITNLAQKAVVAASAGLAEHGYQCHSTKQAIIGAIVALLTWYISHRQSAATSVVGPGTSQSPKGKIPLMLWILAPVLALAAVGTGCTSAITSGHVVSVTERGFGIVIAQSTAQETPEVKLGFFSSAIVLEPTVTNQTLTVPAFANTFALGQSINPFAFDVNETIASGDYQTGNMTNPIAAQPIVPSTNGNWPPFPPASSSASPAVASGATTPAVSAVSNAVSSVTK